MKNRGTVELEWMDGVWGIDDRNGDYILEVMPVYAMEYCDTDRGTQELQRLIGYEFVSSTMFYIGNNGEETGVDYDICPEDLKISDAEVMKKLAQEVL